MSVKPIIDAGPGLNFLSIHKERLLIAILGPSVRQRVFRAKCCASLSRTSASALPQQCGGS